MLKPYVVVKEKDRGRKWTEPDGVFDCQNLSIKAGRGMKNLKVLVTCLGIVSVAALLGWGMFAWVPNGAEKDTSGSMETERVGTSLTTLKALPSQKINRIEEMDTASQPHSDATALAVDDRVVKEYVDAVTLTTGNSVATVDVQLMNNAPHFCTVEVRSVDGRGQVLRRQNISAPPFAWSDWTVIHQHMGRSGVLIKNIVRCDAGVIRSRVRYFK